MNLLSFGPGWIDAVIAITLVEAAFLLMYRRRTGRGIPARDFLVNLLSGLCLMAALRCSVAGAGWIWIVFLLTAAGLAHVADLCLRWTRQ